MVKGKRYRLYGYIYSEEEHDKLVEAYGEKQMTSWYEMKECEFIDCNKPFWFKKSKLKKNIRIRHFCDIHNKKEHVDTLYKKDEAYRKNNRKACYEYYHLVRKPKRQIKQFLDFKVIKFIYWCIIK